MQTNELNRDTLRRLAELRPERGKVVSLYMSLDPTEFATPQARTTQVHSLLDDGARRVKELDGLSHDDRKGVDADLVELREFLEGDDFVPEGAHGIAAFRSSQADLFELIRLPRPVTPRIFIDDSPLIEPLAEMVSAGNWALLLLSRRTARLLRGSPSRLDEMREFRERVRGESDEGSQAIDQRSVDADVKDHVTNAAEELHTRFRRRPFDRLLVGCSAELWPGLESRLHADLARRLAGRFDVEVERSSPQQVLEAAAPVMEEDDRRREREALDRMAAGLGAGGHGAAGLDETLAMLTERRVETLLFEEGFSAPGVVCGSCGWIGAEGASCPVDGSELEQRDDVIESAVELALEQAAEIVVVHHHDDLGTRGSIGAVLRF